MEPENTLDGIKDINNLLCDKIKDIIEWWRANVNCLGDRIGHYRLVKLNTEKNGYDIYDEREQYCIYDTVSSSIYDGERCSALIMQSRRLQVLYMEKIEALQSLFEPYKKFIDNKEKQTKKEN